MAKFKTRARTVDMLGRQQIAGIPNAISELFKNAHDAYADHVEIDYFRSDGIFILRDDGLGMTKKDFEDRWLTLGTESKLAGQKGIKPPPADPTKKRRPITGEKGIGRLAIAVIGPQVLVLTRAKRNDNLHDLVAAFLHWGLFEAPGINLDQIEIPVRTFPGGTLPGNDDLREMVEIVRSNTTQLKENEEIEAQFANRILQDLADFKFDLIETANFLGEPTLLGNGHGTHFYIFPASDNLATDLDTDLQDKEISRMRKLLLGFSNTMTSGSEPPPIATAFRYWPTDEQSIDIIADREFFTPEEFELADHHIEGDFDEYGQFVGIVSVYGEEPLNHVVPWPKARGRPVSCGPFSINVAYVPGLSRESKIPSEEYARLVRRLNRIGGLYIYQDGIRVLPYGDSDVDFLEIEKRRSLGAKYYFFSYRRMFGAIEITRKKNSRLAEKAGREGFQENKAYREFKAILMNFFVQIAADFFRTGGEFSETWFETKAELNRLDAAKKKQAKQSLAKRRTFSANLESFFTRVENGEPQLDVEDMLKSFEKRIQTVTQNGDELSLVEVEVDTVNQLADMKKLYRVERPRSIGLNRQLKRDWRAYGIEWERLEKDIFSPTEKRIGEMVAQASHRLNVTINERQRVDLLLNEAVMSSRTDVQAKVKEVQKAFKELEGKFDQLARQITGDMRYTADSVEAEFNQTDISGKKRQAIEMLRHRWENKVVGEATQYAEVLVHLLAQLENINWFRDEDGHLIGDAEITSALEDEVLALRERAEVDLDLTQLGMAIEVINHEFNNSIKTIRTNLKRLKGWADTNPSLQPLYNDIRTSFDHLDGYLTLFTPLHRRLYRKAVEITGADIVTYLEDLFNERMNRHQVCTFLAKC